MKKNLFFRAFTLLIINLFVGATFVSCSKGDNDKETPPPSAEKSPIIGKWEISNQNAQYGSFEFTVDKKYIITQRKNHNAALRSTSEPVYIIIFGDYSSINENGNTHTLDLKKFGTATVTISGSTATITINGETYTANKVEEIDNSTHSEKTELLCYTWYPNDDDDIQSITFTSAGTYFAEYKGLTSEDIQAGVGAGTWEWAKDEKLKIGGICRDDCPNCREGDDDCINARKESNCGEWYICYDYLTILKLTKSELILLLGYDEEEGTGEMIERTLALHR